MKKKMQYGSRSPFSSLNFPSCFVIQQRESLLALLPVFCPPRSLPPFLSPLSPPPGPVRREGGVRLPNFFVARPIFAQKGGQTSEVKGTFAHTHTHTHNTIPPLKKSFWVCCLATRLKWPSRPAWTLAEKSRCSFNRKNHSNSWHKKIFKEKKTFLKAITTLSSSHVNRVRFFCAHLFIVRLESG